MKTKNIFKTLAAAMLMPAMLLTTACSSEDDAIVNNENTAQKGYTLPVTVNVTRQGDDATRATFNETDKKLEFSAGDKLLVRGNHSTAGKFAGTLDYVSDGTFRGTITTKNEWTGTANALFSSSTDATLLPAGYESYQYFTVYEYGAYDIGLFSDATCAFATTKAAAVEQFSRETASYNDGFALQPQNAILNFTVSGLTAGTEVAVEFRIDEYDTISGSVTTDAEGEATFAVGVAGLTDLNDCSLTVGGKDITLVSSSKELWAGKIYNITRSVAAAGPKTAAEATAEDLGKLIGADGKIYDDADAATAAGTTAVAMIAYVGSETDHATYTHGLAIALSDESGEMNWATAKSTCEGKTAVTNAAWVLPSQDEWKQMFRSNGGSDSSYSGLNTAITNAGGTGFREGWFYWSSTEYSDSRAYDVFIIDNGSAVFYDDNKGLDDPVRACLAF